MFDARKFKAAIVLAGLTSSEVAKRLGIHESTLYRKIKEGGDFSRSEINDLVKILGLDNPNDIFFADELAETQEGRVV